MTTRYSRARRHADNQSSLAEVCDKVFQHQDGSSVHIDGADIYFESRGTRSGSPLVLLHGGLGSIEDFSGLPSTGLCERFHVIGIDSRGHGRSSLGGSPLSYRRLELDVLGVLNHLGIREASLLGFSDGGVVGYRLALGGQVRIIKLATIGAGHDLPVDDPIRSILSSVTAASWLNRFPGADALYNRLSPDGHFDQLVTHVVSMWLSTNAEGYPGPEIARLSADLLVIRGDGDHLFPLDAAAALVRQVAGAHFANVPLAGHAAHADQPEIVARILETFFALK